MTPLLHFSAGSICFIPRSTFKNRRDEIHLNKYNSKRRPLLLLQPTFPLSWISSHNISKTRILTSAVEADVAVEADPNSNPETSEEAETISEETEEATSTLPDDKVKGVRMNVKKEDLIPGANFTGIVRSMKPFGVFVDIGSFTDGLVHISQISSDYVKDVEALFTVGQEVEVWLLDYDVKAGRISLTMRNPEDERESSRESGKGGSGTGSGRGWSRRRPRYVEGESYLGTIKEITEEGATVILPGDGEGFLPVSEQVVPEGREAGTTLEAGEDIMVRVLSIDQDDIQLTMKEEEYMDRELLDIIDKKKEEEKFSGAVGKGYEVLEEEMEYEEEGEEGADEIEEVAEQVIEESTFNVDSGTMFVNPFVFTFLRSRYAPNAGKRLENIGAEKKTGAVIAASPAIISEVDDGEVAVSDDGLEVGFVSITEEPLAAVESEGGEVAAVGTLSETELAPVVEEPVEASDLGEGEVTAVGTVSETASVSVSEEPVEASTVEEVGSVSETASVVVSEESVETSAVEEVGATTVETVPEVGESESATVSNLTEDSASVVEEAVAISESEGSEVAAAEEPVAISKEEKGEVTATEAVSGLAEKEKTKEEADQKAEVSDATPEARPDQTREVKATISPSLVKQLREETGAGMMDCKKALAETNGDLAKAQEYLRKKGLASADKKASRTTAEGRIGSYVHDGRIGVLVEVNCETDFVSRGDIFKELVEDIAMQVAACPQVTYLTSDEVPEEMVQKEKEIEMQREDILSKPENIREKIVEGRIRKRLEEFALLEQPFIKNDKVVVKDHVKQTIATIGENIKVKRFLRFNLGEGLEKKSQDFAAEVAAQTAAKPAVTAADATPPEKAETTETAEKPPSAAVTISAALVKQLREETGAGMMDCKKALAETGGDIEKAQEYLRKKGLSSADKKSSRLAAEGLISAYIHDSRIGSLIEVNSETDFVARNEKFKELADDLAMQVVACPQVEYVSIDDVPASIVEKEKAIEMQREDLQSKPEQIRERIVEGRISKRLGELALLEQPFIKDDSVTVKEIVKRTIAALGENIKVRRFVRFTLGESKD